MRRVGTFEQFTLCGAGYVVHPDATVAPLQLHREESEEERSEREAHTHTIPTTLQQRLPAVSELGVAERRAGQWGDESLGASTCTADILRVSAAAWGGGGGSVSTSEEEDDGEGHAELPSPPWYTHSQDILRAAVEASKNSGDWDASRVGDASVTWLINPEALNEHTARFEDPLDALFPPLTAIPYGRDFGSNFASQPTHLGILDDLVCTVPQKQGECALVSV